METGKSTSTGNKVTLKYVFDEQTLLQLKSLFKEIDGNQQSSYQNMTSECKLRQIKFSLIRSAKILSFTGKVEKKKVQTDTPGKYITHYLFECYDITPTPSSEVTNDMLAIWECGRRDARTVLNLLSRNITELEIEKITTYQIYARTTELVTEHIKRTVCDLHNYSKISTNNITDTEEIQ